MPLKDVFVAGHVHAEAIPSVLESEAQAERQHGGVVR